MVAWSLLLNLRNELMSEPPLARAGEIVDIAPVLRIVLSLDCAAFPIIEARRTNSVGHLHQWFKL
jgi:hypothetical protein